jgi:hypothetical protein
MPVATVLCQTRHLKILIPADKKFLIGLSSGVIAFNVAMAAAFFVGGIHKCV